MDLYKKIYTEVAEGRREVTHEDLDDYIGVIPEDDCPRCWRTVTDADPGVKCDSCQCWHHAVCEGISAEEYGRMMNDECDGRPWYCGDCTIIPDTEVGDSQPRVELKSGSDVLKVSRETVQAHLYKSFSQELEVWVRPDTFEILSAVNEQFAVLLKFDSMRELVKQGMFKFEREGSFEFETTAANANVIVTASSEKGEYPASVPKPPAILPFAPSSPHETSAGIVGAASSIGEKNEFEFMISSSFYAFGFEGQTLSFRYIKTVSWVEKVLAVLGTSTLYSKIMYGIYNPILTTPYITPPL